MFKSAGASNFSVDQAFAIVFLDANPSGGSHAGSRFRQVCRDVVLAKTIVGSG
jgi:hypothetical protein